MLNTNELEKRWLIYKIKSYMPYFIIILSLLIISFVVYSLQSTKSETSPQIKTMLIADEDMLINEILENENEKVILKKQKVIKQKTPNDILVEDPKKVKLLPSLDFMRKMQNATQMHRPTIDHVRNIPRVEEEIKQEPKHAKRDKVVQEDIEEFTQELEVEIPKTVNIRRKNTEKDIYDIIKRFKKNNNPVLSLFVAKKYYELGDYKQAYNYALTTNRINKEIDESWIIFAKSLVKLGKKDSAINILKQYIEHSHSNSAKILIQEIRSGKFK